MRSYVKDFSPARAARVIAVCMAVGLAVTAVMLMLFAVLMTVKDLPDGAIAPMALSALGVGCLAAGFAAARRIGRRGLLVGAITGAGLCLLTLTVGWFTGGASTAGTVLFKAVLTVLCGAIGGVLGVDAKRR